MISIFPTMSFRPIAFKMISIFSHLFIQPTFIGRKCVPENILVNGQKNSNCFHKRAPSPTG